MFGIKRLAKRLIVSKLLITLAAISALTASIRPTTLEQIQMKGELIVVTRNTPTTYYQDRSGETGYEFELAKQFADSLEVDLVIKTASSFSEISHLLDSGQAHIAAAGLAITPDRGRWMKFSSPYMHVTQKVIYRRGGIKPRTIDDLLNGKLVVSARSNHATRLRELQLGDYPTLGWSEIADLDSVELLQLVAQGQIDFTIVDSNEFSMLKDFYPNLLASFDITDTQPIAWAMPHSRDTSVYDASQQFFNDKQNDGTLEHLEERFYGHLKQLDYVGTQRFLRHKNSRLVQYDQMFQKEADKHQLDWRLLAAMSYQESHWNPEAKSYTGVRGLMMLTRNTAKELEISNRLDPAQSIQGGAEYLAKLRKRLEKNGVAEPDRSWMALAAYNVGYGHLRDARKLTENMGGNKNLWVDVKDRLPLLSQKRYFKETTHGFARGHEPVQYVQNIRRYYDILVWNDREVASTDAHISLGNKNNLSLSAANQWQVIPPLL